MSVEGVNKPKSSCSGEVKHELGPLPEPSEMDGARWGYTAEQLRAYALAEVEKAVKAERERCAKICADTSLGYKQHSLDMGYQEHQRVNFAAYSQALADMSKTIAGLK